MIKPVIIFKMLKSDSPNNSVRLDSTLKDEAFREDKQS